MDFKILTDKLIDDYTRNLKESPLNKIDRIKKSEIPVDYFQFYKSVSSVYSSKIEGEAIREELLLEYYSNIRKIGLEYENLDYSKSLDFLLMTIKGVDHQD